MQKIISALTIILITSCAAVGFKTKEQQSTKYIVEKCLQKELDNCGDKLCEMSTNDVYPIIEQLRINILACVEDMDK